MIYQSRRPWLNRLENLVLNVFSCKNQVTADNSIITTVQHNLCTSPKLIIMVIEMMSVIAFPLNSSKSFSYHSIRLGSDLDLETIFVFNCLQM